MTTAARHELTTFGPDLPMVLQRLVEDDHLVLPDAVYRDVLPNIGNEFLELDGRRSQSD